MERGCFFAVLFICTDVWASVCADGDTLFSRTGDFVVRMDCGDMVGVGDVVTTRFPDTACGAGVKSIKTSAGVSVSLYSNKYAERAICVAVGDAVCYANLVSDRVGAGVLGVHVDGVSYYTKDASLCLDVDANGAASLVQSNVNSVNWSSVFQSGTVRGVAHCSSLAGIAGNVTADLTVGSAEDVNYWCWCRMTLPVLSKWVFGMEFASDENCTKYCAARCAEGFAGDASFRTSMLHNVYNISVD